MGPTLTIDLVHHINNAGVFLLGVNEQFSVNYNGEHYTKRRIPHDCSFLGPPGLLAKKNTLKDTLQTFFYGFCLIRILHIIETM